MNKTQNRDQDLLIIDDNKDAVDLLNDVARSSMATPPGCIQRPGGINVGGEEADVAILDLGMPDMTGMQLAQAAEGRSA